MKIRILDENFVKNNKLESDIIDDTNSSIITLLDEQAIPYEFGYICDDCGEFHKEEYIFNVNGNGGRTLHICEHCIDDSSSYFYCDDCEEWYTTADYYYYITEDDRKICQYCRDNYVECHECGSLVHINNSQYCEECDEYFCDNCWDEHYHSDGLLDYHSFRDWQPHKTEDEPEPDFYIGHELEMDYGSDRREAIQLISNNLNGICMHDGSLSDEKGLEFISHPLSYNYMLSLENDYRNAFRILTQDLNYKSHETDDCGLHFHVTRPGNPDIIDRIILFMETYKDEIIRLSRRTQSEIDSWCKFLSDRLYDVKEKELKSLYFIKKNKETSLRYMALNLTNANTIEFRIFKGTLKYETFMADFEFVYNLMTLCSDIDIPVSEITWERVVSMGKFLPQYANEHNLHTDKIIVDYSQELIIESNRIKDELRTEMDKLTREVFRRNKDKFSIRKNQKIKYEEFSNLSNSMYYTKDVLSILEYVNTKLTNIDILTDSDIVYIKDKFKEVELKLERRMI